MTVYKKKPVVCTAAPQISKLTLKDIEFILAKSGEENVVGLTASQYEKASSNDQEKYKQTIFFGLIALHYLKCINKHNETTEET